MNDKNLKLKFKKNGNYFYNIIESYSLRLSKNIKNAPKQIPQI